jgi:hypothetical protein
MIANFYQLETPTGHRGSGNLENGFAFQDIPVIGSSHGPKLHLPLPVRAGGGRLIDYLQTMYQASLNPDT